MGRLIKAFFFKLSRDLTFRITLIIGAGLAILLTGLFLLIDIASETFGTEGAKMLTGPSMLLSAFNPVDNFGLAIPVNLITFICLEFSQGTIRNKIIAGHSKFKIYASLFISGVILTFLLLIVYAGLCTVLGTIFGGFNLDNPVVNMSSLATLMGSGYVDGGYIAQLLITAAVVYINIVAFTIFFAALFRNIGPCIPVVIIALMMLSFGTYVDFIELFGEEFNNEFLVNLVKFLDPLYVIAGGGAESSYVIVEGEDLPRAYVSIATDAFVATIINNLVYAAIFFAGGALIFQKRDVK